VAKGSARRDCDAGYCSCMAQGHPSHFHGNTATHPNTGTTTVVTARLLILARKRGKPDITDVVVCLPRSAGAIHIASRPACPSSGGRGSVRPFQTTSSVILAPLARAWGSRRVPIGTLDPESDLLPCEPRMNSEGICPRAPYPLEILKTLRTPCVCPLLNDTPHPFELNTRSSTGITY